MSNVEKVIKFFEAINSKSEVVQLSDTSIMVDDYELPEEVITSLAQAYDDLMTL